MKKITLVKSMVFALSLSLFSPMISAKADAVQVPKIYAKSAVVVDMDTMEVILDLNSEDKMYPASTTKLMTAILLAENKSKEDVLTYTKSAKKQPAYSLNASVKPIDVGSTMTSNDVMKALLLYSANDSAYIIADNVATDSDIFIEMMNEKAKEFGMKSTNFVTANGLHDENHYSTALDIAILGKKSYDNSWVRETLSIKKDSIELPNKDKFLVENRNKFLGQKGNIGGKTGYTSEAGKCFVSIYERDGRRLVSVVLKSIFDSEDLAIFNDTEKIIDASYSAKKTTLISKGDIIETLPIQYKSFGIFGPSKTIDVPLTLKEDIEYYENPINTQSIKKDINTVGLNPWKLNKNLSAAKLTLKEPLVSKKYALYPKVSTSDLIKANLLLYIGTLISIIIITVLVLFFKSKLKRNTNKKIYF
ncbi:D-alanyl-D-alanine carboxypeptidase [Clostridium putrefaciens]|uniref:D-alanyl-D-alanine carboxypeptidase n=1 Tax=Clostridium putrefaciens TaxID=99675 RepID=A0A381J7U3_9CLOT|nr:D-alanyl-D-alanine carboxypeptidase family protein [Clostridium putrefaciens]SUY46758.1 D-alanyl-D-alanine carboxypeptidase [Clostridium putrefaciens]